MPFGGIIAVSQHFSNHFRPAKKYKIVPHRRPLRSSIPSSVIGVVNYGPPAGGPGGAPGGHHVKPHVHNEIIHDDYTPVIEDDYSSPVIPDDYQPPGHSDGYGKSPPAPPVYNIDSIPPLNQEVYNSNYNSKT